MWRGLVRATIPALLLSALPGCFAAPPQIISLIPGRGATGVAADAPIVVAFDHPIQLESLRGRFAIRPALPGCDLSLALDPRALTGCSLRPLDDDRGFRLDHPGSVFAPSTTYAFTLSAGVSDPTGAVNSIDHQWELITEPAPVVRSIQPDDGAGGVSADAPLSVTFSRPMREATTGPALSLSPPIDGTRVLRNATDPARYVVIPGRLLRAGTSYRLTVAPSATDEHGQRLLRGAASAFVAGQPSDREHAVLLGRRRGEPPTQVILSATAPVQPGDPTPTTTLLDAPRCGRDRCGAVPEGAPTVQYLAARLSPRGRALAVVEQDLTSSSAGPSTLLVVDLADGHLLRTVAGGTRPAWSPDGRLLAFAEDGGVAIATLDGDAVLPPLPGPPLTADPVWSPDGQTLALTSGDAEGSRIDLASPLVDARYALPGVDGPASDPAIDDAGRLVLRRTDGAGRPGLESVDLRGGGAPRHIVDGDLRPLGFDDDSALVASDGMPAGSRLVRVDAATGQLSAIEVAPGAVLTTVTESSSRRLIAYVAHSGDGSAQVVVSSAGGAGRHPIADTLESDLEPVAVSLN